ncbi:tyrosine-protein kinase-like otk isoform X2 [Galleria mellonella]|uniref:Tyrosine-protein kinase-like otk isoform X2 n=1 Tax=Galleria mellonella TaxID=7137 RepID=A0ABM3M929_GALME|nr:tyrosine-protein kinase-like otk isoform X2 [Galleria mellonella]
MCLFRGTLFLFLVITVSVSSGHHSGHRLRAHKAVRRHRAIHDGALRFEPEPYSKKLELNSSGKIHCKVAGGVAPSIQWYLNEEDPLPDGVTSSNGTLLVTEAARRHAGRYTCRAVDGNDTITAKINLDIVVSPRILEPSSGQQVNVVEGQTAVLNCLATGDPQPTTQWDRNRTLLLQQPGVSTEDSANASSARLLVLNNGSLIIRNVKDEDSDMYGCLAGSAAGLARNELVLLVHAEGTLPAQESSGVGGKAVVVSISVAAAYMILVLALMYYCRRRRLRSRQRGEKMELEMAEGREKLVEEGEEDKPKVANGSAVQNGRLLPHDRDSGADNSEVSGISRASKKSGQYDHLTVPRTLLTEQITLGRGEFGEVMLAKIDMCQVKKLKSKDDAELEPKMRQVLVKVLTTKDETQLSEFKRQLELFGRIRHENIVRLIGLCNEADPHYMLLEHTDWGDLKSFLIATRTAEETAEYLRRVGPAHPPPPPAAAAGAAPPPLAPQHRAVLAAHLAAAAGRLASKRLTHRDIAARNCVITSQLQLKLSLAALTRGPHSHEYCKRHDQVIPLRWLPSEAVLEGEYSTKSDVYMFAATVWEIYTKAELPFGKLNDNSVMERLKNGTLEWTVPDSMPDSLAALLKRCWSNSPADRPQFTEICEEMTTILQNMTSDDITGHTDENNA